jgi:PDZ domain-containing protein
VRRFLSPTRLAGTVVGLAVLALVVLYLAPSSDFLLLPDRAHPVAPLVHVQGGKNPTGPGGIYFVDVFERRASMLESLFPFIRSGSTLVPANLILPPGVSDNAQRLADLREMSISQKVAAAVALKRLGYHVVARPAGVVVTAVELGSHAVGKLQPTDVIDAVNGAKTPTIAKLRTALSHVRPGQTVALSIRRGSVRQAVAVKTVPDPLEKTRALVGFTPGQAADIHLPLSVQIDAGNVGGPSAGLAFALEVMEKLGHNVDHGYRVAATGEIELDGAVTPIGGVKQKTFGAREAKADVFLVPAGDNNARDAKRYAHGLRIIAVTSFPQALRALATLPPKR